MIDMSDENKQYLFRDIIARMKTTQKYQNMPTSSICAKVVVSYLKAVFAAVLAGFVVELPHKFGSFMILKSEVKKDTEYYEKHYKKTGKQIQLNMKRIGFKYQFVLKSPILKKFHYRTKVNIKYRKELQRILTETNFDYRTNTI